MGKSASLARATKEIGCILKKKVIGIIILCDFKKQIGNVILIIIKFQFIFRISDFSFGVLFYF